MDDPTRWVRFEEFDLDLETGDLLGPDGPVAIQPLPSRVLALLASRPGALVTREEIERTIWGEATFAADQALNTCIRQIRIALGDSASEPRFVATVPRRGYRFVAHVAGGSGPAGIESPAADPAGMRETRSSGRLPTRRRLAAAATAGVVLLIALLGIDQLAGSLGDRGESSAPRTAADLTPELRLEYLKARELLDGSDSADWRGASRAFDVVRRDLPDFIPATAGAGHAALRLGELERAAGLAAWTLAADSAHGEAHMILGTTLLQRGEWERARDHLERARRSAPGLVASYTGLAVLAALEGRAEDAMALAEESVEVAPMSAITLGDAGYIALWSGRPERSLEWCGHAGDLRPDDSTPRYCLLDALHALDDTDAERDQALEIMASLDAPPDELRAVRDAAPAEGLRRYRNWQRQRLSPEGDAPPGLAGYLAFLRMQDGDEDAAVRLLRLVADADSSRLRLTLLDPVLAPLRGDPRLTSTVN